MRSARNFCERRLNGQLDVSVRGHWLGPPSMRFPKQGRPHMSPFADALDATPPPPPRLDTSDRLPFLLFNAPFSLFHPLVHNRVSVHSSLSLSLSHTHTHTHTLTHTPTDRHRTPAAPLTRAALPMDSFRHQRSPGSERFLALFDLPPVAHSTTSADAEDELHEDDIFWTGADTHSFDPCRSPMNPSPATASPNPNPSPAAFSRTGFWRFPERNFGILAALPEDDKKRQMAKTAAPFLQRKTVAASSAGISTSSSSASTSPSSVSSSARMIPTVPKSKSELELSMPGGKIYHQSAPVNVPVAPPTVRSRWGEFEMDDGDLDGDDKILPPHEIVARKSGYGSPMTTFSVLEGIGRTLKGRDLRRVRNAVWRKTGFID